MNRKQLTRSLSILALLLVVVSIVDSFSVEKKNSLTRSKVFKNTLSDFKALDDCKSGTAAKRILESALQDEEEPSLYNSVKITPGASSRGISDGDLRIQTRLTNNKYDIFDLIDLSGNRDADRASLGITCLTLASVSSAIVANQSLNGIPEILRFLIVWALCFSPFVYIGYGIALPEELQSFLQQLQSNLFPAYRQRMIQHEAGHLLMGHLLGLPVAGYQTNAMQNAVTLHPLADPDLASDRASQLGFDAAPSSKASAEKDSDSLSAFDAPFYSKEGRGAWLMEERSVFREKKNYTDVWKLSTQNDPKQAWPFRGFDEKTLDQLTVIAVAGVCAEILALGNAQGGIADYALLRSIFASAEIDEREADHRIRFALGFTLSQLRKHIHALDAVAAVMERDGTTSECVLAIETCTTGENSSDYEIQRRADLQGKANLLEKLLIGGDDNSIDTSQTDMVEGKGGGYRKETFRLTGDDPLYAALVVAGGFLLWALSGGISLH